MDVRKFHDKVGWCAGYNVNCAGAVYRTEAFMATAVRVGSNPNGRIDPRAPFQNIHIEHTLQMKQFHEELWPSRPGDDTGAIRYLVRLTPTTAMTFEEKSALDAFEKRDHRNKDLDHPFARYSVLRNSVVWNVFTEKRIDVLSYGFDSHLETVRNLTIEAGGLLKWLLG